MGRPRLIILIRHAQSEGNKNRDIHQSTPDHRVKLTPEGWTQAREAGRRLRSLLREDDTLQFFTSPYQRTRETTEGILSTLTANEPEPTPFPRSKIKVYEEPRLREQDFGNFQPCSAEMERMWQERADYGHFFYRIPNGESAADAYDRVSGFNESLWRQFGDDDFASVCVLVTHGLMSRVFLMKWYHFSVEYFEDLRNVKHCEFLIMEKEEDTGKYMLQNKLRTWSELRWERAALQAKEDAEKREQMDLAIERPSSAPLPPRRWGGCPQGCSHGKNFNIRRDLAELIQFDEKGAAKSSILHGVSINANSSGSLSIHLPTPRRPMPRQSDDDSAEFRGIPTPPQIDTTRARDELILSPVATPSFGTFEDGVRHQLKTPRQHLFMFGRDGGGTYSGHASAANSDTELSEGEAKKCLASAIARVKAPSGKRHGSTERKAPAGGKDDADPDPNHKALANRLGDAPPCGSDHGSEEGGDGKEDGGAENETDEGLRKEETYDRSIRGSVY